MLFLIYSPAGFYLSAYMDPGVDTADITPFPG